MGDSYLIPRNESCMFSVFFRPSMCRYLHVQPFELCAMWRSDGGFQNAYRGQRSTSDTQRATAVEAKDEKHAGEEKRAGLFLSAKEMIENPTERVFSFLIQIVSNTYNCIFILKNHFTFSTFLQCKVQKRHVRLVRKSHGFTNNHILTSVDTLS